MQLSPGIFREQAKSALLPAFPADSIRDGHSGIAVADVHVSVSGKVLTVQPLQSPDAAIRRELVRSLSKWTFLPTVAISDSKPVEIRGRVMFLFSLKNGMPKVIDLETQHSDGNSAKK